MKYLVWSNVYGKWQRSESHSYTDTIEEAGRYAEDEAQKIVAASTRGGLRAQMCLNRATGERYQWTPVHAVPAPDVDTDRPRIAVLCGSTRFRTEFDRINAELTMAGWVVIGPGVWWSDMTEDPGQLAAVKEALDRLHLRKIDMADVVWIVNVGGYVGASTSAEIRYARSMGKPLAFVHAPEPEGDSNALA